MGKKTKTRNVYIDETIKGKNKYYYEFERNGIPYKQRGFSRISDAENAMIEVKMQLKEGRAIKTTKLTVEQYMEFYLKKRDDRFAERTKVMYESYIRQHITPFFQGMLLSKLQPITIEDFIAELKKKGLSEASVKRIFAFLNGALNYAVNKLDLLPKNPTLKIDKPTIEKDSDDFKPMTLEEIKRFLDLSKLDGSRIRIAFFLAIMTGMRQSEILGLSWDNVIFHEDGTGEIRVRQALGLDGKTLGKLKTKSSIRNINISESVVQEMKRHRHMLNKERLLAGEKYEGDKYNLVVSTSRGTPVGHRQIQKLMNKYRAKGFFRMPSEGKEKDNKKPIKFHDLRHCFASVHLALDTPMKVLQKQLGHSNFGTTMNIYAHLLPGMAKEASNNLSKAILES